MKDKRYETLANNLINYSVNLKKGENIFIDVFGCNNLLARELVKKAYEVGGQPYVNVNDEKLDALIYKDINEKQLNLMNESKYAFMKKMDAYIAIRERNNIYEGSIIPQKKGALISKMLKETVDERVKNTKWCVMRYPNDSMAQLSGMPTDEFEDFYFNVCNLDYSKMSKAMDNLVTLMEKTDKVRLVGVNTDLTFSIKGQSAIKCAGEFNIPDGEVFVGPIKNSFNGKISYNTPAVSDGLTYENIVFEFEDGKIIKASANYTDKINEKLNADEGARFIGEFAIGVNPYITKPMKDTLFDEKIAGSIHLTPGQCYDESPNGNDSVIHWDLVMIQTKEYGGGKIYFDDVLIRKDGIFVLEELQCLNPDNLK